MLLTSFLLSCGDPKVHEPRIKHDFNGDGIADVLIGANRDDDGGNYSGVAFIFYGSTSLASSIDGSAANVKLIGEDASDYFGLSVSGGSH